VPILTHGSDLSLAPTIRQIVEAIGTVTDALSRLATAGFEAVQLDAALSGIRPRELDRRARKDLLALMTRRGMRLGGIDLLIPRRHYVETEHQDRAMQSTLAAIELAADLGRVALSIALPVADMDADLKSCLVEAADGHGVRLAVHAEDQLEALEAWLTEVDLPAVGAGVDPAAMMAVSLDPSSVIYRTARRLVAGRLSDQSDVPGAQGTRCVAGSGDLDLSTYRVALDLAANRAGPIVLDLRSVANPLAAATAAKTAWENAAVGM